MTDESLAYIRRHYGVPARRGVRVRCTGGGKPRVGRITSGKGPYIRVRFPGEKRSHIMHPTWEIEYLPKGGTSED